MPARSLESRVWRLVLEKIGVEAHDVRPWKEGPCTFAEKREPVWQEQ